MKIIQKPSTYTRGFLSIFLLTLFLTSKISAQQKDFAFFYQVEYSMDTTDLLNKEKDLMVLWTTPSLSLFQSYNGYLRDSVTNFYLNIAKENDKTGRKTGNSNINQMIQDMGRFPHAGFSYKILKSKNENVIYSYHKIFKTDYVYTEPFQEMNWQIGQGSREIMGYPCQIASTYYGGREFVAWFTADIPINDGPYNFNGLPGLILELYDSECHYHFKLVGIERRGIDISELLPTNVLKVDKAKYFKIEDEFRENTFSQMSDFDASRVSQSAAARVQERLKSKNNRLELIIEK